MSNSKQLPSPEEWMNNLIDEDKELIEAIIDGKLGYNSALSTISTFIGAYAKEVINYTLEQVIEKAKIEYQFTSDNDDDACAVIDRQSILSLEDQIIDSLKL